ncbi:MULTISPECIES: tRNA (adenosine(37)-N6)-threonylcarbamoyltransferase complex dimerization subunit type 1 TsaB [Eubacterium]|uniref:tRNA threonylcarbamoyl adenosine modification protein YeaZ n=1 Tax=Eubacterium barkeri TaxID=1528 RepID=A0A1H3E5C4_EUBBA|nr:tRNA (adenosine(37)-N6)-threonylcarbamoyltransferase complex dimerization subunit type 1 TsaB [Eubacterium barkeri]SDX73099.1 tRNA threonylcarbamoyl adenosine modification protein YeaZ [Eubacterium barkeri]
MRLLMVDTATIVASAAVIEEEKLVGEVIINHQKKHSEKLLPAIDHLLMDAGLDISEIDAFGIVCGPGSFTGLRIGMATVKGFAQALNKPVVGVSTLEALAYNLPCAQGIICPILDAQRDQVYTGVYQFIDGCFETLLPDTVLSIEALIRHLSETTDGPIHVLGDGVPKYFETMSEELDVYKALPYVRMNRASSAAWLALEKLQNGQMQDYKTIEPMYIRPSYAEEQKKK